MFSILQNCLFSSYRSITIHPPKYLLVLLIHSLLLVPAFPAETSAVAKTINIPAVSHPELIVVRDLLLSGGLVNKVDDDGMAPLHYAVKHGNRELILWLIENEADVNILDADGWTPLMYLVSQNIEATNLAQLLLKYDANISIMNDDGLTAVDLAYGEGLFRLAVILESPNLAGNTVNVDLLVAILEEDFDAFIESINSGADVNFKSDGMTALHLTSSIQNLAFAKTLLENGATVENYDSYGDSPIDMGLYNENLEFVLLLMDNVKEAKLLPERTVQLLFEFGFNLDGEQGRQFVLYLVENGVDVNQSLEYYGTPVDVAIERGWADVANEILAQGGKIDFYDDEGRTLLHRAAIGDNFELLRSIIDFKANLNALDSDGRSPLMLAVFTGDVEAIKILITAGANTNIIDNSGKTLMDLCFHRGDSNVLTTLLMNNIALDIVNANLWVYEAVQRKNIKLLSLLLDRGASPDALSINGNPALFIAIVGEFKEGVAVLLEGQADPNIRNNNGQFPLHLAITTQNIKIVTLLLKKGAEINKKNGSGNLPLHLAVSLNNNKMVKLLLKKKADPLLFDGQKLQPWQYAFFQGNADLVELLVRYLPEPSTSHDDSLLFDDPRVQWWSALYLSGQKNKVLKSVEKDILSTTSHPFASQVWVNIHDRSKNLKAAIDKVNPALKSALGILPQVTLLRNDNSFYKLLEEYPPSYNFTDKDIFALIGLSHSAQEIGQIDDMYQYIGIALSFCSDIYQLAWMTNNQDYISRTSVREQVGKIISLSDLHQSPFGELVSDAFELHEWKINNKIDAVKHWLNGFSFDARAWSHLASLLTVNGYYDEALIAQQKGYVYFPFYSNYSSVIKSLIRLDMNDTATKCSSNIANIHGVEPENIFSQGLNLRYLAHAYKDTNDNGQARRLAEEGISRWPENPRWISLIAQVERFDSRYEQANEYLKKYVDIEPQDQANQILMIRSLIDLKRIEEGLERFLSAKEYLIFKDEEFLLLGAEIYGKLGRKDDQLALLKQTILDFPQSIAVALKYAEQLWDIADKENALIIVEEWANKDPTNKEVITHLAKYYEELRGIDSARIFCQELLSLYSWSKSLWEWHVEILVPSPGENNTPLGVWQDAADINPGKFWPWEKAIDSLVDRQKYKFALALIASFQKSNLGVEISSYNLLRTYLNEFWVVKKMIDSREVSHDFLEKYLNLLELYKAEFGNLERYYGYLEPILNSLERRKEAAFALYKRSEILKDSTNIFHDLVAKYDSELTAKQTFGYGYRMLQRDPCDSLKNQNFLHKHTLWGGSPIVALRQIEKIKKLGLDIPYQKFERKARASLGDYVAGFMDYYDGDIPDVSDRYLNWFSSARQNVLTKEHSEIAYHFEEEFAEVEIVQPDGQILVRRDHPEFGKITYLGLGGSYLKADYDKNGNIILLASSSGRKIEFVYDDANNIETMFGIEGEILRFEYDLQGQMRKITLVDVGSLLISYDENGETDQISSDNDHDVALKITTAFQSLNYLSGLFAQYRSTGQFPEIPFADKVFLKLKKKFDDCKYSNCAAMREKRNAYVKYLVNNINFNRKYYDLSIEVLDSMLSEGWKINASIEEKHDAVVAIELWSELIEKVKPHGVPIAEFSKWSRMVQWLRDQVYNGHTGRFAELLAELTEDPIKLLNNGLWLDRSDFVNDGYWHRYSNFDIFSDANKMVDKQTVLIRNNGEVLIGSAEGLLINRKGYWEWLGFDDALGRFSRNMNRIDATNSSFVISLAESPEGVLWIGTAKGLFALDGKDYEAPVRRWLTSGDGLNSPRIDHLGFAGDQLYIGTPAGLHSYNDGAVQPVENSLADLSIDFLKSTGNKVLVGSTQGLDFIDDGVVEVVNDQHYQDAIYAPEQERIFLLKGNRLFYVQFSQGVVGKEVLLAEKDDLLAAKKINGLGSAYVPDYGHVPVVLTDMGIGFFKDDHFQFMKLPFVQERAGLEAGPYSYALAKDGSSYWITTDGVYGFELGRVFYDNSAPVYDLITDSTLGITFIARGDRIDYIDHDESPLVVRRFSSVDAKKLAFDSQGSLLANDNSIIVKFAVGETNPIELFDAVQNVDLEWWQGGVKKILTATDGSIWVAAGSSVFHLKNGVLDEFNYTLDADKFPSKSEMISNVYESLDGKIYVVASVENHLNYQGIVLSGGLLVWNGLSFDRVAENPAGWFVTGYTKISADEAIISTNGSFYREKNNLKISESNNLSYANVEKNVPMFWLGHEGDYLGDNDDGAWLFPSAGGVVLYKDRRWLYPQRLNRLLPDDQAFGQYGARTSHAVATDNSGRVYVGTDRGLLVYNSYGAASLFIDEGALDEALVTVENKNIEELKDVFLPQIEAESEQGQLLNKLDNLNAKIFDIESNEVNLNKENVEIELKRKLKSLARSRQRLLARLEKEHYGLFQMLKLDPRELSAMSGNLTSSQLVVQYLPTTDKLYIQVTTKDLSFIREVEVSAEKLYAIVSKVVLYLRSSSQQLRIDKNISSRGKLLSSQFTKKNLSPATVLPEILENLAWLYDHLLRPVESELSVAKDIFIVPVGTLTYLPFSALVRQVQPTVEYAVQHFTFGIMPSMFHFNLISKQLTGYGDQVLLVADPDGSLPGARAEVEEIETILVEGYQTLTGEQATKNAFEDNLADARIIHLATHGIMDSSQPGDSYLLMANNKRLNVIEISTMDLEQTELVVLSACESGIGPNGMEYATLARAFAHAKVPTVVASLWPVNDLATKYLMADFYANLDADQGNLLALANAQRTLLKSNNGSAHPAAWSAFTVFGK